MIHLKDISYVRLGTRDLAGASRYVHEILGLQTSLRFGNPKNGQSVCFRSDAREHTLVYFDGDPMDHTTGFELCTHAELQAAAAQLQALGYAVKEGNADQCEQRRVKALCGLQRPLGQCH